MSEFFQSLNPLAALGAIFALRIVEVTLSTFRIILLIRGRKVLASTVAFFASLTWLVAAAAVFSNLDSPEPRVSIPAQDGLAVCLLLCGRCSPPPLPHVLSRHLAIARLNE